MNPFWFLIKYMRGYFNSVWEYYSISYKFEKVQKQAVKKYEDNF